MNCAICGQEITDDASIDHVFPQAILKWSKNNRSSQDSIRISKLIKSKDNQLMTHKTCNISKEDFIININKLHLDSEQKESVCQVQNMLKKDVEWYESQKQLILSKQNNRCKGCGKIISYGILRRINDKQKRTWDNACIVCHKCNRSRKNFEIGGVYE